MTAEIISVGTELLLGQIVDSHAATMARVLADVGIGCRRRSTVGDHKERIVEALRESLSRADVVVMIGGLGPTEDDLTREAIAAALDEDLVKEPEVEAALREWFAARGYAFAERNAKQALRPESARMIDNPHGTAPGLVAWKNGKTIFALPGPKGEFDPMANGPVREILEGLAEGVIHSRTLRVIGIGESMVDERLSDLMAGENPTLAPYAHVGEVHLRLTARAETRDVANAMLDPLEAEIRARLGASVYGVDETTLTDAVVATLIERGQTLAVAESMTGGLLAAELTGIAGVSEVFRGGWVVYTPEMKAEVIDRALVERFGPVSREVAAALASSVRERTQSDLGLAIVGNAGPTSDVDGKPVGLVYVALAGPEGAPRVEERRMRGTREDIRTRTVKWALETLRNA